MSDIKFTSDFARNAELMDSRLNIKASFDLVGRTIIIAKRRSKLWLVDGMCKDDLMEKIMTKLMSLKTEDLRDIATTRDFADSFVPYVETEVSGDVGDTAAFVLSGGVALVVEGFGEAILIDARTYPVRGVEEPENSKVLRGAHEGFVETLVFNTAMLRRRLRDPALRVELVSAGTRSRTDIALCWLDGKADTRTLERLRSRIAAIKVNTLAMSQESLMECLVKKQRFNPFPKVRYTERPDSASACVAEGSIIIFVDNSPVALIVPSGILEFLQDTNDYYFPPLIGTYLRVTRMLIFALTLLLTPVWYLLVKNPEIIPPWLSFLQIEEPNSVPVIAQLLIGELTVDALKLASLNTPSSLASSFSVIGALVIGQFAVDANWLVPEVVLYMAFVAVANFAQPSFELGYAFKLSRVFMLVMIAAFNYWGFAAAFAVVVALIASTKTVSGRSYLYPLIPFNAKALGALLLRRHISGKNT